MYFPCLSISFSFYLFLSIYFLALSIHPHSLFPHSPFQSYLIFPSITHPLSFLYSFILLYFFFTIFFLLFFQDSISPLYLFFSTFHFLPKHFFPTTSPFYWSSFFTDSPFCPLFLLSLSFFLHYFRTKLTPISFLPSIFPFLPFFPFPSLLFPPPPVPCLRRLS